MQVPFLIWMFFSTSLGRRFIVEDVQINADPEVVEISKNVSKLYDGVKVEMNFKFYQKVDNYYIHGTLVRFIKENDTTISMFDRRIKVCQLQFHRNSRDFVFAFVSRMTAQFTNFSTCPIMPNTYALRNVVLDSKLIPGFVSLPDTILILSASYCRKQKNKKESCFVDGVVRVRHLNN